MIHMKYIGVGMVLCLMAFYLFELWIIYVVAIYMWHPFPHSYQFEDKVFCIWCVLYALYILYNIITILLSINYLYWIRTIIIMLIIVAILILLGYVVKIIKEYISKKLLIYKNYNMKTNTINIKINCIISDPSVQINYIETKYSSSNTIKSIINDIEDMINERSSVNYNVYRVPRSFLNTSFYNCGSEQIQNRCITEFSKFDIIKQGLTITLIQSHNFNHRTKKINIPITAYNHCNTSSKFTINATYSDDVTIHNLLNQIQNTKHFYIVQVQSGGFVQKAFSKKMLTEFLPHNIITHGLKIRIIEPRFYDHKTNKIRIPIMAYDHYNNTIVSSKSSIYVTYSNYVTIGKIIETIQTANNYYVVKVRNGSFGSSVNIQQRPITDFDISCIITKGLHIRVIEPRFYDQKTKQIRIPIKGYDHNNTVASSQSSIYVTYSDYVTVGNILEVIQTSNNYYIVNVRNESFGAPSNIRQRAITEFDMCSVIKKGLHITIIQPHFYDHKTKNIRIPIVAYDHNEKLVASSKSSIYVQYSACVTVGNILEAIQTLNNYYIVGVTKGSLIPIYEITSKIHIQQRTITEFDICNVITKGLKITIIDQSHYDYKHKQIKTPVIIHYDNYLIHKFSIQLLYASCTKIKDLLDETMNIASDILKQKTNRVYILDYIRNDSFFGAYNCLSASITNFTPYGIVKNGLSISLQNKYNHTVNNNEISCPHLNIDDQKNGIVDRLNCPIYKSLINNEKCTADKFNHLHEYSHFKDEYNQKPICKRGVKCDSFIRLEEGGNELCDQCHIKLYRHPPRNSRQINLAEHMKQYIVNTNKRENKNVYMPTEKQNSNEQKSAISSFISLLSPDDKTYYKYNDEDGYIDALMKEVIRNGYKYELCMQCSKASISNQVEEKKDNILTKSVNALTAFWKEPKDIHCSHDVYKSNPSTLLSVVDAKLKHARHVQVDSPLRRDQMLALVLYTSCDCNHDLCSSQREGNYEKWKWFDLCLYEAIKKLNAKETGVYKLFSGLDKVKLTKKFVPEGYFVTYTSTTWERRIAQGFMGSEGMLIEVDEKYRGDKDVICCDVSWISKFPDECEILIARSINNNKFSLSILDEVDGVQMVSLQK